MINGIKIKIGEYRYDRKIGKVKMRRPLNILSEQDNKDIIIRANNKRKGVKNVNK